MDMGPFADIASQTTKDFNGDGITDQYGFDFNGGNSNSGYNLFIQDLAFSNDAELVREENGYMVRNITSMQYIRAINVFNDLKNLYKVLPPFGDQSKPFRNERAAMIHGSAILTKIASGFRIIAELYFPRQDRVQTDAMHSLKMCR
jgi:hypothetical protein